MISTRLKFKGSNAFPEEEKYATLIEIFTDNEGAKIKSDNFMGISLLEHFPGMFEINSRRILGKVTPENRELLKDLNAAFYGHTGGFQKS